jgi:hypothetical protein
MICNEGQVFIPPFIVCQPCFGESPGGVVGQAGVAGQIKERKSKSPQN